MTVHDSSEPLASGRRRAARVLFVDDEPDLLSAMVRGLRKWEYQITTAQRGAEALNIIRNSEPFAVIVSDLRMPEMDGVALLEQARRLAPDTVRILFTGTPDLEHAIAAINKGSIFRFMTKPCPNVMIAVTLNAAIDQHNLVTAERVLLEQTLHGSIKALLDILAAASPMAFGRGNQLRASIGALASNMGIESRWQVEIAALLSQIGYVILPPATLERVYKDERLSDQENGMLRRMPAIVEQALANIPRLEPVRDVLRYQETGFDGSGPPADGIAGEDIPWGARALKVILDIDKLERNGLSTALAFDTVRGRTGKYDPKIVEALADIRRSAPQFRVSELPLSLLHPGMILAQDIHAETGVLVVARGQELSPGLMEKLRNFFKPTMTIRVVTAAIAPDPGSA